jgi:hypothetical protein
MRAASEVVRNRLKNEGEAILRPSRRMDCFRLSHRERATKNVYACFGAIFDPSRCRGMTRLTSRAFLMTNRCPH